MSEWVKPVNKIYTANMEEGCIKKAIEGVSGKYLFFRDVLTEPMVWEALAESLQKVSTRCHFFWKSHLWQEATSFALEMDR